MINAHPAIPFFAAAFLILFLSSSLRRLVQPAVPVIAFVLLPAAALSAGSESSGVLRLFGYNFILLRTDALALLFVYIFLLFAFLANLYALHAQEKEIHIASNIYVGSSLGAVLAGDVATLFIFWELMAVSSAVLIWNKARSGSLKALFRYLLVHLTGGLFFFSGLMIKVLEGGSLAFQLLPLDLPGWLILIGFSINAAIPPLHAWLPDAYPEGTPAGSVYLSAFTTKVAVYAFARAFAGAEVLIWLGAVTAVYGVVYALMENDIRRLLSYHIVCQVGYMICGIGLGTELAIDGAAAHAVGNILFKGLLFMAAGSIIYVTGRSKLSDLGGLAKNNKLLLLFYMIGAFAISGAPFLNGYVSKSMLLEAAGHEHMHWLELTLLAVAVGTFLSIALKLAYFAFWSKKTSVPVLKRLPFNMALAMAGCSVLCLAIGIQPELLYRYLPHGTHAHPYTAGHVIKTWELLAGTYLAFLVLLKKLHTKALISLDIDWFYRVGASLFVRWICNPIRAAQESIQFMLSDAVQKLDRAFQAVFPNQVITAVGRPLAFIVAGSILMGFVLLYLARVIS